MNDFFIPKSANDYMQQLLTAENVRNVCDPQTVDIDNITQVLSEKVLIGQKRAIKALTLGLSIKSQGFNIYVSGPEGTGKLTAVKSFVEKQAAKEPVPADWCYVNNFKDPYRPQTLSLPAGTALQFKKEMKSLIQDMYHALIKAFESEEYANKRQQLVGSLDEQQTEILGKINEEATKNSFLVKQTPTTIITIPAKDNKPLTDEEINSMSETEIDELNKKQDHLQELINASLREVRKLEKAMAERLDNLAKEVAEYAIGNLIGELTEKYKTISSVIKYLQLLKEDIMNNLPEFIKQEIKPSLNNDNQLLKRYEVTVLVDNTDTKGAPVIIERNSTYNNLLGRVEKESYMGTLISDFTMIRNGALHTANGGYLIIRIEEILNNYFAWDCLKRALKNREIAIEEATDQLGYLTTRSLKPEPIPLNLKVILIGNALFYQLLYQYDNDFRELFKVKADFDSQMPRTADSMKDYNEFIQSLCNKESLPQADSTAVAKIVEYGSRLADEQNKLSTCFGAIADIIREASFYAAQEQSSKLTAKHIANAIEEKIYRSSLIQEKINEMITTHEIFIDTSGEIIGQINGLSVLGIGDISFGIPTRITCTTGMGKEGVITIEREAELSGPIHTKGVLILTGYLTSKFLQDKPISLAARLVFEQSYSEVEGDSASSTELYAILSSLASLPIKQGIAVTGSVNQKGMIQPIGGVNEKIEGYFEICKHIGLNGEQGVMIPAANVRNLMLKEEIADAIKNKQFKIWAVDKIEDGIEILTGVKAGSIWEDGTVFGYVNNALNLYADKMKAFAASEGLLENGLSS
ncbi:MAG: AAA family ATPase [Bacteroidetes bacterium]|nr:AAA family ATPase [Bacteroidota bacterium]